MRIDNHPRISVVIVAYNSAPYIGRAIESILAQSAAGYEIVVQDDCSHDETVSIAESFADSRIRVFRNSKNVGIVANSNCGIANARGEFVTRLDADDFLLAHHLEICARFLTAYPTASLTYGAALILQNGHMVPVRRPSAGPTFESGKRFLLRALRCNPCMSCATMFRKDAFLRAGTFQDSYLASPAYNDYSLWLRLAIVGDVVAVEDPIAVWTRREDSVSFCSRHDAPNRSHSRYREDTIEKIVTVARAAGVLTDDEVRELQPLLAKRWLQAADTCALLPDHRTHCIKKAWIVDPWTVLRSKELARIGLKTILGLNGTMLISRATGRW